MRPELPAGTVTFVFTDVEGSTSLLTELGVEQYADALAAHRTAIREASADRGGVEVDTQGDAFFLAFPTAPGALAAVSDFTERLAANGPIRVRVGIHTGTPSLREEGYVGHDIHRAARIAAAGHGGQVLVSTSTAELVNGFTLRDLGEHRLKDLSAPERLYQLGDETFPPLKTLFQTNLPVPSTPFIARERELGEVVERLMRADVRLLTLTGAGGAGKTRLALQAAGRLADRFAGGVWWVPLASLDDARLVLSSASHALGTTVELEAHIATRDTLVLFDNFEHVVEAADGLSDLLTACPNLKLLVTSRERLRLSPEHEYVVPPLSPDEGASFFVARARAVKPDFEPDESVRDVCRLLDGLPLALELAAARVKALTTPQMVDRLGRRLELLTGGNRDLPHRQRTLRATIQWSHDLLAEPERQLFARLAVFAGGFTLSAAEAVCGADDDAVQALVERSLLRFGGERFTMLETIREYALERLDASQQRAELLERHAQYFLEFAEGVDADEWHWRATNAEVRAALWPEVPNMLAALAHFEHDPDREREIRLVALFPPGSPANPLHGGDPLARLTSCRDVPPGVRARALQTAVVMATYHGDYGYASELALEWLGLSRALGDHRATVTALRDLALIATFEGRFDAARRRISEVEATLDTGSDELRLRGIAWTAESEGHIALYQGQFDIARMWYERSLTGLRQIGETSPNAQRKLASIDLAEGRLDDAATRYRESLENRKGILLWGAAVDIDGLAAVASARDHPDVAARLLGASELFPELFGYTRVREPYEAALRQRTSAAVHAALGGESFERALAEGRAMSPADAVTYALQNVT